MLPTASSKRKTFAARYFTRSKSLVMGEQSRSPGRPPGPCRLGPVLKAGWLRKQRSIMKNWQQRWFVLRGNQLFYYKDKDETKPQGFISLQGTQVTELLPGPEDPGKHLFEISPGGAGEREKVPANPEALLLMASSQRDMEDWVQAIRRVILAPLGGGTARSSHAHPLEPLPAGIFGQRLEDTVHHERKYGPRLAPLLVEQCVDFIRERGLTEEGLFRMPGQANLVRDLQDSFDCGEKPLFDSTTDVHTVASLLKLYLRELPEPVIPFARYEDFLSCAQLLTKDEGEGTLELAKQVSNLPQANYNLLRYICKFLDEVQSHSNINKMSVQNLATVFGPNILRPQIEDPVTIMEGTSLVQHLMTVLIRKHSQLFTTPTPEGPASPCRVPQCTVGWDSEEIPSDSQGEPGGSSLPTHRTSSLDGPAAAMLSRTSPPSLGSQGGPAATSPGKRVQTLPNWKSSFRQPGSRSGSPKAGSSSLEVPIISSGGNWLMNGLSSLRGHRRASSGDRLKNSGSTQRLSTYDNVPPPSLFPSTVSVTSTLSSREASISSCTACRASDSSTCSSLHTEWALEPSPLPSSSEDHRSLDLGHSLDEAGVGGGSSSEPKDPGSPTQDHSRHCQALQSVVAELRAELSRQRTEYETSLKSMEANSADLRKQMSRLEEELDQEKKKYTMLEIKLRNSERAREDAERRNQLLQKEMEEFFSTLGSLTVGVKGARAPK
ncbi:rho GTPase-activating protein 22 isoform X1 [Marmota marmota marmota]|uniref:rho GTPase-activating protein 22 isoform X1 n=1 Tax=Marmota marmota marmota TaxID=9994 RepID=UPI0020939E39|nr:rho GTPase-activating protein 22 isoform X1 [Marmota marmota marmota]XP_048663463.1 rho GTPase-activating protein 22 isoform X1 [Marmota marmota marmota]